MGRKRSPIKLWSSECETCCVECFLDMDECISSCVKSEITCNQCKLGNICNQKEKNYERNGN